MQSSSCFNNAGRCHVQQKIIVLFGLFRDRDDFFPFSCIIIIGLIYWMELEGNKYVCTKSILIIKLQHYSTQPC
jgi:hypothetical protein